MKVGVWYAISHLEDHARSIEATISAYGKEDSAEAVAYWTERLRSVRSALASLTDDVDRNDVWPRNHE